MIKIYKAPYGDFYQNPAITRKGEELMKAVQAGIKLPYDQKPFVSTYCTYLRKVAEYREGPSPQLRQRIEKLNDELHVYYHQLFWAKILDGVACR